MGNDEPPGDTSYIPAQYGKRPPSGSFRTERITRKRIKGGSLRGRDRDHFIFNSYLVGGERVIPVACLFGRRYGNFFGC